MYLFIFVCPKRSIVIAQTFIIVAKEMRHASPMTYFYCARDIKNYFQTPL